MSLRKKLKGLEAQVAFSSTFLVRQRNSGGVKQDDGVNDWLPDNAVLRALRLWSGMCLGETEHVGTRCGVPHQAG